MAGRLEGKRTLVTHADRYLGPPVVELFSSEGADVVADGSVLDEPDAAQGLVDNVGHIDVLVANFAGPREYMPVTNMMVDADKFADQNFQAYLDALGPAHIENNMYYTEQMLADESVRQQFEAQIPAGRLGTGTEAAELALSLASSGSDFLAGQVIPISGGWTA